MTAKQILVIDDEGSIRANLLRFLRLEGFQVREAANGALGLASVQAQQPDLVLCDVMMPVMDGFEVLRRLREEPATAALPFIFLTASVEVDDERFGTPPHTEAHLTKPFNLPELLALIRLKLGA
jgi:CheY-like chemotaxis protein